MQNWRSWGRRSPLRCRGSSPRGRNTKGEGMRDVSRQWRRNGVHVTCRGDMTDIANLHLVPENKKVLS